MSSFFFSEYASAACDCGSVDAANPCTGKSITVTLDKDYTVSFTWSFNSGGGDAYCGQFANGDYWVAPNSAAGQSSVTLTSIAGAGSGAVTADDNPQLESTGILGENNAYPNKNAAENLFPKLPITYSAPVSILAAIQRDEDVRGNCGTKQILGSCVDAYNTLTVLDSVPENAGSTVLRPNLDDTAKDLISFDDINITSLPRVSYFTGADASSLDAIRETWSHCSEVLAVKSFEGKTYSEGGRAFRAELICGNYGANVAQRWHNHLSYLLAAETDLNEAKPALAAMLTYGKDLFYAIYDCEGGDTTKCTRTRNWGSGAGQSLGKFPPAVFFAAMAKDQNYGNYLKKTSEELLGYADIRGPHELDQVNIGHNGPVWGDGPDTLNSLDHKKHWGRVLLSQCYDGASGGCNPHGGKKVERDPYGYIDGPPGQPGAGYMSVSAGPQRALVGMMLLMPKMCEIVNYPSLVEYMDRIVNHGVLASNDPCAPPDPREDPAVCVPYKGVGCKYYGGQESNEPTWGPDPNNPMQCIKNNSGSNTGQRGRFPDADGSKFSFGYESGQFRSNWDQIRGSINNTDCTAALGKKPSSPVNVRIYGF